jgi:putative ABC transport system permease protein
MALGIGTTTAMFTVVQSVLLRPLAYRDPHRLVVVLHGPEASNPVSPADYLDYRRQVQSFAQLGAAQAWGATLSGGERPESLVGLAMTANMFDLLGVPAAFGRTFVSGEDEPGRQQVAVLSHGLWARRFGRDQNVVGRTIQLDARPYTVIGVMPPDFRFAPFWITRAEIWVPLDLSARRTSRDGRSLRVFGRLKDGTTIESAQAEMTGLASQLAAAYPETNTNGLITVRPLLDKVVAGIRPTLLALLMMVGFVLLIACANVSNALLARLTDRQREMAVRSALGASRARIVGGLLTESVLLAAVGAAAGVLVAWWGVHWLVQLLPAASLPRQEDVGFDLHVFLTSAAVAVLTGLVAGLAPAWHALRPAAGGALQESSTRTASEGGARKRVQQLFVATEVMLALVLLVGAALMGRTLTRLLSADAGFDVAPIAVATVSVAGTPHAEPARRAALFDAVRERLTTMPGVVSVSATNHLPLAGDLWNLGYRVEGRPLPPPGERWSAAYRIVQPDYFRTMGVAVRRGREFTPADGRSSQPVAVVNETMARRQWPGEDPVGRQIYVPGPNDVTAPLTIVGVVADMRQNDWTSPFSDEVFLPYAQRAGEFGLATMTFVLRTSGDPSVVANALPRVVVAVDPSVPVSNATTMSAVVREELWRQRISAQLTSLFALVALGLALLGVYAVVSYSAARRAREFGIRVALGASVGEVRSLAVRDAFRPVVAGAVAGVALAFALTRWLQSRLTDVDRLDPQALAGAVAVLLVTALAAAWVPARRASLRDPAVVLRQD